MTITKNRKTSTLLSFFLIITMCIGLIVISPVNASAEGEAKFLNGIDTSGASVDIGTKWGVDSNYDTTFYETLSSEASTFEVSTPGQLAAIAKYVNEGSGDFSGKTIVLNNDIDLDGKGLVMAKDLGSDDKYTLKITGTVTNAWTPIGNGTYNFAGTFDGGGFEIKNMVVLEASPGNIYAGLFGYVSSGAEIKDLGIGEGSHVVVSSSSSYSYSYAGGIAGYNNGTITNCYNTGTVSSSSPSSSSHSYAGGIAGYNNGGSITNCYNTGAVYSSSSLIPFSYSYSYTGGIAGYNNNGSITNCYNTGVVPSSSQSTSYTGGIAGLNNNNGSITNCYNTGTVTSSIYAGGIAGNSDGGSITNCYNTGTVTSSTPFSLGAIADAGGIAGYNNNGSITNCYNTGDVSSSSRYPYAGGIAGVNNNNGSITNSYNTGNVSSVADINTYAGGIVGDNRNNGTIADDCFYDEDIVITGTNSNLGTHVTDLANSMANSNYRTAQVSIDDIRQIFQDIPGYLVADTWYFASVSTVPEENGIHPKLLSLLSYQIEVTANPAEGGTASANRQSSTKDFRVTLSAEASEGYRFVEWGVVSPEGLQITNDSFTMPSSDVQITAKFEALPSEPVVYNVISAFPTYTGGNEISAKINADYSTFEKLLLEGDEVDKSNYKIDNGSTIITLNNSYLSQFKDGTYQFRAVFTGGYADLALVVALEQVSPPAQVIYPIIKDIPPFGGSGDASITIGADSSSFERLILNNKDVDKSNYTVTSGEGGTTVITLKESFLKIFPEGNFTFRAVFTGGYTDFTLKVDLGKTDDDKKAVDTKDSSKNVATGDNTPIGMLVGLIVLAGVVLTVLILRKKIVKS